jgi:hypothetical protein
MEAETDTGRQPGHLRKNGNKKRQISVRENWRAKNSHYYTELHGTIMPMQCYTCPEEEQCFFLTDVDHVSFEKANETRQNNLQSATVSLQVVIGLCKRKETAALISRNRRQATVLCQGAWMTSRRNNGFFFFISAVWAGPYKSINY